ncbi:MAG: hypothetical protein U1F25_08485 [Rubrivivax sp.]
MLVDDDDDARAGGRLATQPIGDVALRGKALAVPVHALVLARR